MYLLSASRVSRLSYPGLIFAGGCGAAGFAEGDRFLVLNLAAEFDSDSFLGWSAETGGEAVLLFVAGYLFKVKEIMDVYKRAAGKVSARRLNRQ